MDIRPEGPSDRDGVYALNASAFETDAEARLVDALRSDAAPLVSLVAEDDGEVVGHILFSPMRDASGEATRLMGLAPMAVAPPRQRSGIGSTLVQAGLEACRELGAGAVVVLGHPAYYPRFGFAPASRFGIRSEYDVPDDVFLALELEPGALGDVAGIVRYHDAFGGL